MVKTERRTTGLFWRWLVCLLAAAGTLTGNASIAGDAERGRLLYETRCNVCHATGVHIRQSRKAASFDAIREQVVRWNGEMGGAWGGEEIDDVAVYLNRRFYFFHCPETLCRLGKANAG